MLFAFIYLVLQKRQVLSESKGEALFSARISSLLLFLSVVSFIVRPSSSLTQAGVGETRLGTVWFPGFSASASRAKAFVNEGLRMDMQTCPL